MLCFAWVQLGEKEKTQRQVKLVLETPNNQLHTSAGEYTVLATRNETHATLLEGETVMLGRGAPTLRVSAACVDIREALGWTRTRREYRNVSVREFVADMNR